MNYKHEQRKWLQTNDLHEGDDVFVYCSANRGEHGWPLAWTSEMNAAIGDVYKVQSIADEGIELFIKDTCSVYYFPYFVLLKESKKQEK